MIGTTSTNIRSLQHQHSRAAVCTIYKMHCSNSPKILRQHLPNPQPLPSRRTRAADTWENHPLQVPLQATHHPDLEIYRRSFVVVGSKSTQTWGERADATQTVIQAGNRTQVPGAVKHLLHLKFIRGTWASLACQHLLPIPSCP